MKESKLTFEQLPQLVSLLLEQMERIEASLNAQSSKDEQTPQRESEQLLTIQEAATLLHLTVPTIYSKHSKGELPGVCKRGKRLYFSKQSLIEWVKDGRKKSNAEIEQEAEAYLLNNKKGLNNGK